MAGDFDQRMRRRSRIAAIARVVFAVFAFVSIVGGTVMRMSRGCQGPASRDEAPRSAPQP